MKCTRDRWVVFAHYYYYMQSIKQTKTGVFAVYVMFGTLSE